MRGIFGRALVAASVCALAWMGGTAAADERGIDPNQGRSLVEVTLASKGAAMRLQLEADTYGVEFNDHYLRSNGDGTVTATVFGNEDELDALADAGYDIGATIEGPATWREQIEARQAACARRSAPTPAALGERSGRSRMTDEIVILRADYFENYAGRFLSVEAKTRLGGAAPDGLDLRRAGAVALLEPRRGHADRLPATDDEHEHRPGHHARHLHRAPRARADRRRRHDRPAAAVADPHRLEHRRSRSRPPSRRGWAAACRR